MNAVTATRVTAHAWLMMRRRGIALEWIEDTLRAPASVSVDERDQTLNLAFKQVLQAGDKWLRVVYRMEQHTHVVVTAFLTGTRRSGNEN